MSTRIEWLRSIADLVDFIIASEIGNCSDLSPHRTHSTISFHHSSPVIVDYVPVKYPAGPTDLLTKPKAIAINFWANLCEIKPLAGIHREILAWGGRDQVHAWGGGGLCDIPHKKKKHI